MEASSLPQRRLRLTVEYDGTDFAGFQRQGGRQSGLPTIQGALEEALERITGHRPTVTGAGRTDAGVHALGQVVHFDTASRLTSERLAAALNAVLAPAIRVREAAEAPPGFHARYSALSKRYAYVVWNRRAASPFWARYSLHVPRPLDLEAMAEAAKVLVGRHDFSAFRAAGGSARSPVRTLYRLSVRRRGSLVWIAAEADGFLYHMVRNLAGTLLEVGDGRRPAASVAAILASGRREEAGPTAPAHGLWLVRVRYPPEGGEQGAADRSFLSRDCDFVTPQNARRDRENVTPAQG